MKWLVRREYRLNRLILITGAVLLYLPYLGVLIALWWSKRSPQESSKLPEYSQERPSTASASLR